VLIRDVDWSKLRRSARCCGRCLKPDPKKRLRGTGDARVVLEAPDAARPTRCDPYKRRTWWLVHPLLWDDHTI